MDRKLLTLTGAALLFGAAPALLPDNLAPRAAAEPEAGGLGDAISQDLQAMLRAPDPARRRAAVEQLEAADAGGAGAAGQLLQGRLRDDDATVRARAAQALGRRQLIDAAGALIDRLADADSAVRAAAAEALGQFGALPPGQAPRAAAAFARALGDAQFEVRLAVLQALGQLVSARALGAAEVPALLGPLLLRVEDDNVGVRRAAVAALGRLGEGSAAARPGEAPQVQQRPGEAPHGQRPGEAPQAQPRPGEARPGADLAARAVVPLLGRLSDSARDVRAEALSSLAALQVTAAAPAALRLLRDPAEEVRQRAALCLGRLRAPAAAQPLAELLLGTPPAPEAVRTAAARALGQIAAAQASPGAPSPAPAQAALRALLQALGRDELRLAAREALVELGPAALPAVIDRLSAPPQGGAGAARSGGDGAARAAGGSSGGAASGRSPGGAGAGAAGGASAGAAGAGGSSGPGAASDGARATGEAGAPTGLSEVSALIGLVRELGATPAGRAQAAAALWAELPRGRAPREAVVEAVGGLGDPGSAPLLAGLLGDGDVGVRRRAVQALRRPGLLDGRALDALRAATRDSDAEVRRGAIEALGEIGDAAALPRLLEVLQQGDADARLAAAESLGRLWLSLRPGAAPQDGERAARALEEAATAQRPGEAERRVRRAAAVALGQALERSPQLLGRVLPALLAPLRRGASGGVRSGDDGPLPEVVAAVAAALRDRSDDGAREVLLDLALSPAEPHTPEAALALDALDALCALRDPQGLGRLGKLLDHRDPLRRLRAAAALGCVLPRSEAALAPLLGVLSAEPDARVRAEAAWAIGRLPPTSGRARRAIAGLRAALARNRGERGDPGERANLVAALALLGGGEAGDADLLGDRDAAVRANAALLLGPAARSPGLRARLQHQQQADWDHRARRAAQLALGGWRGSGPGAATERRHFLGMHHVDYDRRPLPEARYRLALPDGLVRVGLTDGRGTAREELLPPGTCEVEVIEEGLRPR